jgi:hypothetical protein
MRCPCEGCKAARAATKQARRMRIVSRQRTTETLLVLRARLDAFERFERNETMNRAQWTCGDGRRMFIKDMEPAHLHFALAKGYRQEYPDSRTRALGMQALEAEACYRLVKQWRNFG